MQILKKEKVRATFFLLGSQLEKDRKYAKELLKQMWKDGHDIGSHSFSHSHLPYLGDDEIRAEMERTSDLIGDMIGYTPCLARPPYGYMISFIDVDID